MNFNGKTALVTGAAAGIGRATAITLAQNGANVIIVDTNEANLERTKNEISAIGTKVSAYICDVSDQKRVNEICEDALKNFGKIEILINNAGIFRDLGDFMEIPVEMWKKYYDVNVMGPVYFIKALLPHMLDASYGRIVNVASVAGVYGNAKMVHYSATKGAVISMTKALAKEVADKGVIVNSVSPGAVSSSIASDDIDYVDYDGFGRDATHIKRSGSHRENANLICFLASDEASYISAQNIQIDGARRMI